MTNEQRLSAVQEAAEAARALALTFQEAHQSKAEGEFDQEAHQSKAEGEFDHSGLHEKYQVRRRNDPEGKHLDCRFFVLDPQHDPLARGALMWYASRVGDAGNEELEMDLIEWLDGIA